jgi:hypothetical protein
VELNVRSEVGNDRGKLALFGMKPEKKPGPKKGRRRS